MRAGAARPESEASRDSAKGGAVPGALIQPKPTRRTNPRGSAGPDRWMRRDPGRNFAGSRRSSRGRHRAGDRCDETTRRVRQRREAQFPAGPSRRNDRFQRSSRQDRLMRAQRNRTQRVRVPWLEVQVARPDGSRTPAGCAGCARRRARSPAGIASCWVAPASRNSLTETPRAALTALNHVSW
jgi:hypothetical protein